MKFTLLFLLNFKSINPQHEALTAGSTVFRDEKRKEKKRASMFQELPALCKATYNSIQLEQP